MVLVKELPLHLAAHDVSARLQDELLMQISIVNCLRANCLESAIADEGYEHPGFGFFVVVGLGELPLAVLIER